MSIKLLTDYHLECLSLTGGCTGPSESTLVKMPHCWKSHVMAQMSLFFLKVDAFWNKYPDAGAGARGRDQARESIVRNIAWMDNYRSQIEAWLQSQQS